MVRLGAGTYFPFPGGECGTKVLQDGSRASSIILPGTWKIPDIPGVQHIQTISAEICSIYYQLNSLNLYIKKKLKQAIVIKKLASIFNHYWVL